MRDLRPEALIFLGHLEEVDDLGQVLLGLLDAGDVGKGNARPRVRRVEGGLTLTEGSEKATRPCAGHAPAQIKKATDEQQRRAEAE